jgi:ketosteroid isomerase-like protein
MARGNKADIIRSFFAAYKSKDRRIVEEALTDDFTFTSPYDDRIDKATYFERCWPNSVRIHANILEKIFEDGDEAFALYKCITNDGTEFRNTEFFTFVGNKVKQIDVYFAATYRDGAFIKQHSNDG